MKNIFLFSDRFQVRSIFIKIDFGLKVIFPLNQLQIWIAANYYWTFREKELSKAINYNNWTNKLPPM